MQFKHANHTPGRGARTGLQPAARACACGLHSDSSCIMCPPHMLAGMQELLPEYREATEAYMAAVLALGFRLLRALALALGLPAEHFRASFAPPMPFLRPLHYAARASSPEQARMRVAAETLGSMRRADSLCRGLL